MRIDSKSSVVIAFLAVACGQSYGQSYGQSDDPCVPEWFPLSTGLPRSASELAILGTEPVLYVGGGFVEAGNIQAKRIAAWDGTQWSPLGAGFEQWTYSGWSRADVLALSMFDDGTGPALYAGGTFVESDGTVLNAIAKFDGTDWLPLKGGIKLTGGFDITAYVEDLIVFDDGHTEALYAAGNFNVVNGQAIYNIARWDGAAWSAVGGGLGPSLVGSVFDMTVFDDGSGNALYAAGRIFGGGTSKAEWIARWNGLAWSSVGGGLEYPITDLAHSDDRLYAVENWSDNGYYSRISQWDGQSWTNLGPVFETATYDIVTFDDGTGNKLIAATQVETNGGLMTWNGIDWVPYMNGIQGPARSYAYTLTQGTLAGHDSLVVSGGFSGVGPSTPATNIAELRGCAGACYPDCDQSTGVGVIDIFDFLCFQNSFVSGEPYACDCDTSTGSGVCDVFDFLCFQNAIVSGCG